MGKILVMPVTATADSVMPDFETPEVGRMGKGVFGLPLDVGAQLALADGGEERTHLGIFASCLEFYSAIGQISHGAGDIEPFRDLPDGVAKADALDVPFVEDLDGGDHGSQKIDAARSSRQSPRRV